MATQRDLTFRQMVDLSFGFLGVQIAYALQSANISRIFATLGADPHQLSFFWILPPLMGMIVQPLIGKYSDRTWCKMGRRKPYLIVGAVIAVLVMLFLPNAGSLHFSTRVFLGLNMAMWFGLFSLIFLDTSINVAMQPFKMMVGDMVNEKQKTTAYSIQSFLCNAGSLLGYLFPIFFTWDLQNQEKKSDKGLMKLLVEAPKTFWTVGLVQFFCWAAFLYMWNYTNGAIAVNCWGVDMAVEGAAASAGFQAAGNWVGVLFAIQAVGSILWATVLPRFKNVKTGYVVSLLIGAVGFASVMFLHNQYALFVSYFLIGFAWAAMLALPFTLLTNALEGSPYMGSYLGLFNCTICLPQIVAAATGGLVLRLVGDSQPAMLLMAGIYLVVGAVCVRFIKK